MEVVGTPHVLHRGIRHTQNDTSWARPVTAAVPTTRGVPSFSSSSSNTIRSAKLTVGHTCVGTTSSCSPRAGTSQPSARAGRCSSLGRRGTYLVLGTQKHSQARVRCVLTTAHATYSGVWPTNMPTPYSGISAASPFDPTSTVNRPSPGWLTT